MNEQARLLARLDRQDAATAASVARRAAVLDAIADRIADLMVVRRPAVLLERICRDVVEVGGFERAMLSRVDGEAWLPGPAIHARRPAGAGHVTSWTGPTRIALSASSVERAVVRDRRARIGTGRDDLYVVAPLAPDDRVVGLLHADRHPAGRQVDHVDRRALELFASGLSRVYERAVLAERLRAQHERLRRRLAEAEAQAARLAGPEAFDEPGGRGARRCESPDGLTDEPLTARETEVLSLMARGRSSGEIADLLVVKPETVRSHVTRILRKTGARNRSEAVARYLTRTRSDGRTW